MECKGMNECQGHEGAHRVRLSMWAFLNELRLLNHPRLASHGEVRASLLDVVGLDMDVAMESMRWVKILMVWSEMLWIGSKGLRYEMRGSWSVLLCVKLNMRVSGERMDMNERPVCCYKSSVEVYQCTLNIAKTK